MSSQESLPGPDSESSSLESRSAKLAGELAMNRGGEGQALPPEFLENADSETTKAEQEFDEAAERGLFPKWVTRATLQATGVLLAAAGVAYAQRHGVVPSDNLTGETHGIIATMGVTASYIQHYLAHRWTR